MEPKNGASSPGFAGLLERILVRAREQGLEQRRLAARAGLAPETLSRLKKRGSGDFATLDRLARVVGLRLDLVPDDDTLAAIRDGRFF